MTDKELAWKWYRKGFESSNENYNGEFLGEDIGDYEVRNDFEAQWEEREEEE